MAICISNIIPINFVSKERALLPLYHFKHFDEWLSSEQFLPWQQKTKYIQKWQKNDICFLQVKSTITPVTVSLVDENGVSFLQQNMEIIKQIGSYIYLKATISFYNIPEGVYRMELKANGHPTLESDCLHIAEDHENTLLFKYSHNKNDKSVLFENEMYFMMRLEGSISDYTPTGNRVVYVDTPLNSQTVKGYSARNFTLNLGSGAGVPNIYADKVQDIFDLKNVEIDGKLFTAASSDTKLVAVKEDDVAFSAWTMEITESINRRGKIFDGNGFVPKKFVLELSVDGKLFGPVVGNAEDTSYVITKIE